MAMMSMTSLVKREPATKAAKLSDEQRRLAEDPLALEMVRRIARKLSRRSPWRFDDLVLAGNLGLVEGALRYRPGEGSFLGYARIRIRGAMLRSFRDEKPAGFKVNGGWADVPKTLGLDAPIPPDSFTDPTWCDADDEGPPAGWPVLDVMLSLLATRDREIVLAVLECYHAWPCDHVASVLRIKPSSVERSFSESLEKLRAVHRPS